MTFGRRRLRGLLTASAIATGALVVFSCRAPTQARLLIATSAPCRELNGVAITVKDTPANVQSTLEKNPGFVTTTTTACTQLATSGDYGSLVLAPGADTGAVIVIAGYGATRPETCGPANGYKGCIVARRAFSFVEHETITIPVSLDPDCVDVPCDALSTCAKGKCVDARVTCDGGECRGPSSPGSPDAAATPDGSGDGPAGEGGSSSGASSSSSSGASSSSSSSSSASSGGSGMEGRCIIADGPTCAGGSACMAGQACCAYITTDCTAVGSCFGIAFCCGGSPCGPGESCCGPPATTGAVYKCMPTAACPSNGNVVCKTIADCPPVAGRTATCQPFAASVSRCVY